MYCLKVEMYIDIGLLSVSSVREYSDRVCDESFPWRLVRASILGLFSHLLVLSDDDTTRHVHVSLVSFTYVVLMQHLTSSGPATRIQMT